MTAFAAAFSLLLTGCSGGAASETVFLEPGTQGADTVTASRGVASDHKLFVSLDQQIHVSSTVSWEVLGEEVTNEQVTLMLETFRMYLQDALDGLTTDEAKNGDLDGFLAGINEKTVEKLTNDQLSIAVEKASAERVEDP